MAHALLGATCVCGRVDASAASASRQGSAGIVCVCMHVCTVCDVAHLTVANLLYVLALVLL